MPVTEQFCNYPAHDHLSSERINQAIHDIRSLENELRQKIDELTKLTIKQREQIDETNHLLKRMLDRLRG